MVLECFSTFVVKSLFTLLTICGLLLKHDVNSPSVPKDLKNVFELK